MKKITEERLEEILLESSYKCQAKEIIKATEDCTCGKVCECERLMANRSWKFKYCPDCGGTIKEGE
jgi:hypothetical protein